MSSTRPSPTRLTLGFVPLLDAAPLIVAREQGFFVDEGLRVVLSREPSWSSLGDKVSLGMLDGGQMLSPMPLAASLGLGGLKTPMQTGLALSANGNAITLSRDLHQRLLPEEGTAPAPQTLSRALKERIQAGKERLKLATVYPYSSHHYQLRHWLRLGGIDPDRDLQLTAAPPPRMPELLRRGEIDGFCVGEPWNSLAQLEGTGCISVTGYQLWPDAPEKVLGVTRHWAETHPEEHLALIRALLRACRWIGEESDPEQFLQLLALPPYLDQAVAPLLGAGYGAHWGRAPLHQRFFHPSANMPCHHHGLRLLEEMAAAGQYRVDQAEPLVQGVYRPELYRLAATELGIEAPPLNLSSA